MGWVALVIAPLLVVLLAAEIERDGGAIAERLIRVAALLVPRHERADQRDEWLDHVRAAGSRGIRPLLAALSIATTAAPLIALLARYDARRKGNEGSPPAASQPFVVRRIEEISLGADWTVHAVRYRLSDGRIIDIEQKDR